MNDRYMGSGTYLLSAYKKHGMADFTKEVIGTYDCVEDMYAAEDKMVDGDFVERLDTYNICLGGKGRLYWGDYVAMHKEGESGFIFVMREDVHKHFCEGWERGRVSNPANPSLQKRKIGNRRRTNYVLSRVPTK